MFWHIKDLELTDRTLSRLQDKTALETWMKKQSNLLEEIREVQWCIPLTVSDTYAFVSWPFSVTAGSGGRADNVARKVTKLHSDASRSKCLY